jgi:hypothetical protein
MHNGHISRKDAHFLCLCPSLSLHTPPLSNPLTHPSHPMCLSGSWSSYPLSCMIWFGLSLISPAVVSISPPLPTTTSGSHPTHSTYVHHSHRAGWQPCCVVLYPNPSTRILEAISELERHDHPHTTIDLDTITADVSKVKDAPLPRSTPSSGPCPHLHGL